MRYLVVIMVLLSASASAAQSDSHVTELEAVDREMTELLQLRGGQVDGYLKVIRTQRKALGVLSDSQWQKQLDLYKGTIEMLRPVLNETQLAQFTAYLGCLIVEREHNAQLSMETDGSGKTNQELSSVGLVPGSKAQTQDRLSQELSTPGNHSEPAFARNHARVP